jgi:simple sugar transport system substrate-binding protein
MQTPVISINLGAGFLLELSLIHLVSQLEYEAGYAAGKRLIEAGVTKVWCVNHEPENEAEGCRCNGLEAAIEEVDVVEYMGEIDIPPDNDTLYKSQVEVAINDNDGDWKSYGFLLLGPIHITPAVALLDNHPEVIMGTFDVSHEIFDALDQNYISFGIDQQPYLQGYLPISLLTYYSYSKQHLQHEFIESGPSVVLSSPSEEEQACKINFYEVCVGQGPS